MLFSSVWTDAWSRLFAPAHFAVDLVGFTRADLVVGLLHIDPMQTMPVLVYTRRILAEVVQPLLDHEWLFQACNCMWASSISRSACPTLLVFSTDAVQVASG